MTLLSSLVLLVLALPAAAQTSVSPAATEVAAALQRQYDAVRDFSADFTHLHEGGVLRRKLEERGTVLIKKPGMMRWEYRSPEKKTFVSDGVRAYFHDPANNHVTVSEIPKGDQAATAALFLTGKGNLTRDFVVTFGEGGTPETYVLRLDPKQAQPEYDWLELVVDRKSLQIRSLTWADTQGGRSTLVLSNYKENIGAADKAFRFDIPRGAEVTYAGRAKR